MVGLSGTLRVTASPGPGTRLRLQLPGVAQRSSPAVPVQEMAAGVRRSSRHSTASRADKGGRPRRGKGVNQRQKDKNLLKVIRVDSVPADRATRGRDSTRRVV